MRPARLSNVLVMNRDHIVRALERPGAEAEADARHQEEHGDDEQQAVHERRGADDVAGDRIPQGRSLGDGDHQDDRQEAQEREECPAQSPGFGGLVDLLHRRDAARRAGERAQPGFDDPLGDEVGHGRQDERGDHREPVVRDDRDRLPAGNEPQGLVGDLGDHRVDRARDQVDREDGSHAGETGRHAGYWMASDAQERGCAERDEDQVSGVGRDARQRPDEDHEEGDQAPR